MISSDILKNPIVLGILAGGTTYLYFYWKNEELVEKNPNKTKKPVNWTTPLIVGVIVWFLAMCFLGQQTPVVSAVEAQPVEPLVVEKTLVGGAERFTATDGSVGTTSYHCIGRKNVKLPNTDVFIDLGRF